MTGLRIGLEIFCGLILFIAFILIAKALEDRWNVNKADSERRDEDH